MDFDWVFEIGHDATHTDDRIFFAAGDGTFLQMPRNVWNDRGCPRKVTLTGDGDDFMGAEAEPQDG